MLAAITIDRNKQASGLGGRHVVGPILPALRFQAEAPGANRALISAGCQFPQQRLGNLEGDLIFMHADAIGAIDGTMADRQRAAGDGAGQLEVDDA